MNYQELYTLRSFLKENYPKETPDQILEALEKTIQTPDELTKSEIATFFAFNPAARVRLMRFVETILPEENSPQLAVWGVASMALDMLRIPDVEFISPDIAAQAIQGLHAAQLITADEKTALEALCRRSSTVGAQTLGYMPTLEQIEQASSLED